MSVLCRISHFPYTTFKTQSALMFDSVYTFAAGLLELEKSLLLTSHNISCSKETKWSGGLSLYKYISEASINGLTGRISFFEGHRSNFQFDILKLKHNKVQKVGFWRPNVGVNIIDRTSFYDIDITNTTLLVMTREEMPYVMLKRDTHQTGNDRFEGFCIDLLKAIAKQVGFQFKIKLVPDNMYGVYNPETKAWNGIVRELVERVRLSLDKTLSVLL